MKRLAFVPLTFAALLFAACLFGSDDDAEATPGPTASIEPTEAPSATSTPDSLATPPRDQFEARGWLQAALGPSSYNPPCPESLKQRGVICAEGDADGDARPDLAYLVPVKLAVSQAKHPATVFIRRAATQKLDELELRSLADASIIGASFFALKDRTGDGRADLSYLQNTCSNTGCETLPVVFTWDGNSWRDVGPAGDGTDNVDSAKWEGAGATSKLYVHGGKLPEGAPAEAGPTRATTRTFAFNGSRYALESDEFDPPDYLYHATIDAERVFEGDKQAGLEAFAEVSKDQKLKDWRPPGAPERDRRPALIGFALFRVALAHAAIQSEPRLLTEALDAAVNHGVASGEPLFATIAVEFRRGYAGNGLPGGCAAVMEYIDKPVPGTDTRRYIREAFNYGYENEPGAVWVDRICPF